MTEQQLLTEKGRICWWRSAQWDDNRPVLFFLHGLTADHSMFEEQFACFEKDCNVLVWDAPGHGRSRPFGAFDFSGAAVWIREILDACGAKSAVLIGQSLGGYFAQSFIMRYPDRVKGFVSIDSTPYGIGYYSRSDVWILKQVEWMAHLYPLGWMKKAMARQVSTEQRTCDNMLQMLAPYGKDELCRLMGLGYAGFLKENRDMAIPCPVLLIVGEKDRTGKVMQYNKAWAERTGYPLHIIQGAAHNANVDRPEEVNVLIRAFLDTLQ